MNKVWVVGAIAFVVTLAAGLFFVGRDTAFEGRVPAPTAATPTKGEKISIPSIGLTVVRPTDWSTVTAAENVRNIRTIEMDDRELQELAARYSTTPVVAFAKYKEPYDGLNPSFKINVRSLGGFAGHPPEEILEAAIPTLRRMFGDLRVDYAPTRTVLSGKAAAYTKLSYTLRAHDREFPTISEIWVVPSGPVFFMIGTGTRVDEKNGSRAEIRAIVDAVQIQ